MATTSGFLAKAFEKYFYDFSMYDRVSGTALESIAMRRWRMMMSLKSRRLQVFHKHVSSRGQYIAL